MKKTILYLLACILVQSASAQAAPDKAIVDTGDVLTLKEIEFDFGKIPQGKPVTHIFEVVNKNGKDSLKIPPSTRIRRAPAGSANISEAAPTAAPASTARRPTIMATCPLRPVS